MRNQIEPIRKNREWRPREVEIESNRVAIRMLNFLVTTQPKESSCTAISWQYSHLERYTKSCMRVFFTSRPERVPIGILNFGLLAVDGVFIALDLAKVCGVPDVWSSRKEPVWVTGRQAFAGGTLGLDVAVLESQVGLEGNALKSSSAGLCCGGVLSHWPRPHRNGRQGVE